MSFHPKIRRNLAEMVLHERIARRFSCSSCECSNSKPIQGQLSPLLRRKLPPIPAGPLTQMSTPDSSHDRLSNLFLGHLFSIFHVLANPFAHPSSWLSHAGRGQRSSDPFIFA